MAFEFHADHIAGQQGGYEPQRVNHWTIRVPGVGGADVIEKSLRSFQMPTPEVSQVTIPYGNEERKVAGRVTVNDGNLVIVDYCDQESWEAIYNWRRLVYNEDDGTIGLARDYKKDCVVTLYSPDRQSRKWTAIGTWPKSLTPSEFAMDGQDPNQLSVPLSCDKLKKAGTE